VGVREHDAAGALTDIHVFDHWCHLATVQDDAELQEVLGSPQALHFDIDIYGLLRKRLLAGAKAPGQLIRFARRSAVALAQD